MNSPTFDFSTFIDAGRKAIAPAQKWNELALQGFERLARQQYAFAGDLLEFSVQEWQLLGTVRDLNELTARQMEIVSQLAEKTAQRSQDLVRAATEQQTQVSRWFDQAATEATRQAA
ncbi:MAG: phasin family protein [Gammaproteobacteria bacterium]|nr:phasin family protein [Gammaproteobacteria bacterium]